MVKFSVYLNEHVFVMLLQYSEVEIRIYMAYQSLVSRKEQKTKMSSTIVNSDFSINERRARIKKISRRHFEMCFLNFFQKNRF